MTKEKFKEMEAIQSEFFRERFEANLRILGLEMEMKEEDVIKTNNKEKTELLMKYSCKKPEESTTKVIEVKLLNSLMKYNGLVSKSNHNTDTFSEMSIVPKGHIFDGLNEHSYKLAEQYHYILTQPNKYIKEYNSANPFEEKVSINAKKRNRAKSSYLKPKSSTTVSKPRPISSNMLKVNAQSSSNIRKEKVNAETGSLSNLNSIFQTYDTSNHPHVEVRHHIQSALSTEKLLNSQRVTKRLLKSTPNKSRQPHIFQTPMTEKSKTLKTFGFTILKFKFNC